VLDHVAAVQRQRSQQREAEAQDDAAHPRRPNQ
jgi:hypothetical protein